MRVGKLGPALQRQLQKVKSSRQVASVEGLQVVIPRGTAGSRRAIDSNDRAAPSTSPLASNDTEIGRALAYSATPRRRAVVFAGVARLPAVSASLPNAMVGLGPSIGRTETMRQWYQQRARRSNAGSIRRGTGAHFDETTAGNSSPPGRLHSREDQCDNFLDEVRRVAAFFSDQRSALPNLARW
jgi:hypothetical protein